MKGAPRPGRKKGGWLMAGASYLSPVKISVAFPRALRDRCDQDFPTDPVDLFFREGPEGRFFLSITGHPEAAAKNACTPRNKVVIAGETPRFPKSVLPTNMPRKSGPVREAIKDIGYEQEGFHWEDLRHRILLHSAIADPHSAAGPSMRCSGPPTRNEGWRR